MVDVFAERKSLGDEKLAADDVSHWARHDVSATEEDPCRMEHGSVERDVPAVRLGCFRAFAVVTLPALHHFYAYHVYLLVVVHLLPRQGDTGQEAVVTVYEPDVTSLGGFQSAVSGIAQSAVRLVDDGQRNGRIRPERLYDGERAVGGTVVDDDDLHLVTLLCHGDDTLEARLDVALYVV